MDSGEDLPRGLGPVLTAGVFAALAWWSWGKWTDPHIDFGNELYTAWQLAEGQVLYRDIATRHGPLSHYLNALWFELFGVSIRTLVFCNLAILAGICALSASLLRRACGRFTALAGSLVLLVVFGFSQYVGIGNFNYVTPYHHFQTHGLALSLGMLLALTRCAEGAGRGLGWCALAGGCLGAVFLTKVELLVPAALAGGVGLALLASASEDARTSALRALAFAAAALVPGAIAWLALAAAMPWDLALRGVLGNWSHLGGALLSDRFYLEGAGLDRPLGNAGVALGSALAILGFLAAAAVLDRVLSRFRARSAWGMGLALAVFAALWLAGDSLPWKSLDRALPLVSGVGAVGSVGLCFRQRADPQAFRRWFPVALWAVYALGMLAKMILKARVMQYGFVLAMPATLLLVAGAVGGLPAWLAARGGGGPVARALALAGIAAWAGHYLALSNRAYEGKDLTIGTGADAIQVLGPRTSSRGRILARTLARLEKLAAPDATLLVLPEGIALNYWLRMRNPTPYNLFLPTEIEAFGEETLLQALRATPPDFVVLAHRPHHEFGVGPFGIDPRNGRGLMSWIRAHYDRVERVGAEPFQGGRFGTVILRRRPDDVPRARRPVHDTGSAPQREASLRDALR